MTAATKITSHRPPRPAPLPSATHPVGWILGLTALAIMGLILGGFLLPRAIGPQSSNPQPAPETPTRAAAAAEVPPTAVAAPAVVPAPLPVRPVVAIPDPTTPPVLPAGPAFELARAIDQFIDAGLAREAVSPSPLASDAEFLRRAFLDLTGRVPPHEKVVAFLASTDSHKRTALIDELLESPAFGQHLAKLWADILIKRDADTNRNLATGRFIDWLAKQCNDNRGWDKIVTDLLSADGGVDEAPQTLFFVANQDNNQPSAAKLAGATANLFMGLQLQCAECHVHPTVEKWTQQDFWGVAAFFGHVKFERDGEKANRAPVSKVTEVARQAEPRGKAAKKSGQRAIAPGDTINIPDPTDAKKTTGTAKATYFQGRVAHLGTQTPYRPKLAAWLTASDNPYFARAAVNRFWSHVFARGIIHPVEDMGPNNKASHPELLDLLAKTFVDRQFDVKFLLRAYCNTQAYNRTSKPTATNVNDDTLLSHMPIKVIGARELIDSLTLVTGASAAGRERPRGRAKQGGQKGIAAPATGVRFFDKREYEDSVTEFSFGIPQMLKQMNTGMTNNFATVNRFAKAGRSRADVIADLYLAALARPPKPEELAHLVRFVEQKDDANRAYQDVFWSLLNCAEFVANH